MNYGPPGYGQPPAQAPQYANPFDGLPGAKPGTDRRPSPVDGWYVLEIERCLYFKTDDRSKMAGAYAAVVDLKVVESLSPSASPVGFPTAWFCNMSPRRKEQADRELQEFGVAVLQSSIEECGAHLPSLTLAATDARNIYMGLYVAAQVTSEVDRKGVIDPATGRPKVYTRWKFYPKPSNPRGLDLAFQRLQAQPNPIALPPKPAQQAPAPVYGQAPVGHGQSPPYGGPPPHQPAYPYPMPGQPGTPMGAPPGPQFQPQPAYPPPQHQPQPAYPPPQHQPQPAYGQPQVSQYGGPPAGPPAGPPPWAPQGQPPLQPAPQAPPPGNPFQPGQPMAPPPGYRYDAATGRYVQG